MGQNLYDIEFILTAPNASIEELRESLKEWAKDLDIFWQSDNAGNKQALKVKIHTGQPEMVFDTCSLFGKISAIKVSESNEGRT